jgi:hypothetical protein
MRLGSVAQSSALTEKISPYSTATSQSFIPMILALPLVTPQGLSRLQIFSATCVLGEYQDKISAPQDAAYPILAMILQHLSQCWNERKTIASDGVLDFEIQPEQEIPSQKKTFRLFRRSNASFLPDFSNPLTAPWLDLIEAERSVSGIKLSTLNKYLKAVSHSPKTMADIAKVISRFNEGFANKNLVRTDSMMLGIAPRSSTSGDEVWILAGGHTPYLLRKRGNGHYKLLGEMYVQGVMFGEAAEEANVVNLTLE